MTNQQTQELAEAASRQIEEICLDIERQTGAEVVVTRYGAEATRVSVSFRAAAWESTKATP